MPFKAKVIMKIVTLLLILATLTMLSGCILTKLVSMPTRVVGAVISIVPVVGNTAHDAIDEVADIIDELPI